MLVVDNLLSASARTCPTTRASTLVEGSIADDDVLASLEDDFDVVYPPRDLPRQPELDREPARGSREQPDHDAEAVRAAQGLRRVSQKVVYSASGCTLAPHEVYDEAEPTYRRTARCRSTSTARTRSRRWSASSTPSTTTGSTACRPCARGSRTSTGPGEILGAGRWRGTPATVWRNVTPTFVYRALKGLPLQLDNGGVASRDFVYVEDVVARPARLRASAARRATSTTSRAASRRRSASSPS